MKRLTSLLFIVFIFILPVKSQEITHLTINLGVIDSSASISRMTHRITDAATQYESYAPVPRFVQFDYAFGSDLDEYKKLNGFGILYITSLNQDSTEYPIVHVSFNYESGVIDLKLIGSMVIPVTDQIIKKVFGNHRIDYYYYLPYEITQLSGNLYIDWNANRKDFLLTKFPSDFTLDFVTKNKIKLPDNKKVMDDKFFDEFANREFSILLKR